MLLNIHDRKIRIRSFYCYVIAAAILTLILMGEVWISVHSYKSVSIPKKISDESGFFHEVTGITEKRNYYMIEGTVANEIVSYSYWNFVLGEGEGYYQNIGLFLVTDNRKEVSVPVYMKNEKEWVGYIDKKVVKQLGLNKEDLEYKLYAYNLERELIGINGGELCLP